MSNDGGKRCRVMMTVCDCKVLMAVRRCWVLMVVGTVGDDAGSS